jgi:hypothetical protein
MITVTFADHTAESSKRNAEITKAKLPSARKDTVSEY